MSEKLCFKFTYTVYINILKIVIDNYPEGVVEGISPNLSSLADVKEAFKDVALKAQAALNA